MPDQRKARLWRLFLEDLRDSPLSKEMQQAVLRGLRGRIYSSSGGISVRVPDRAVTGWAFITLEELDLGECATEGSAPWAIALEATLRWAGVDGQLAEDMVYELQDKG